jgi:hypothetical protein
MRRFGPFMLYSAAGGAIGAAVAFLVVVIWQPSLGRLDILSVVELMFTVVVTALAIVAALLLSGLWTDVETRASRIEEGLRDKQRAVANDVYEERRRSAEERQRAQQPPAWAYVIMMAVGIGLIWLWDWQQTKRMGDAARDVLERTGLLPSDPGE